MAQQLVESLSTDFEPSQVPRHLPRAGARADRAQGRGRGDRGPGGARGARGGAGPDGRARGEPRPPPRASGKKAPAAAGGEVAQRRGAQARRSAASKRATAPPRSAAASAPQEADQDQGVSARRRGRGRPPAAELSNLDKVFYPADRLHQGPGDRLLHADRAGAAAAPARPAADAEALSGRRRGPALLREAVPVAPAGLGEDRAGAGRRARRSTSAWRTTCRRSCGWRTWPTSSCTPRCRRPATSSARR